MLKEYYNNEIGKIPCFTFSHKEFKSETLCIEKELENRQFIGVLDPNHGATPHPKVALFATISEELKDFTQFIEEKSEFYKTDDQEFSWTWIRLIPVNDKFEINNLMGLLKERCLKVDLILEVF